MSHVSPINPLPIAPEEYDQDAIMQILIQIEESISILAQAIETGYSVSNGTTTRTLDVTVASTLDVAKVLGTLIDDMKNKGILG